MIFGYQEQELKALGAEYTAAEIYQQPEMWNRTYQVIQSRQGEIEAFLQRHLTSATRVILTGAGTSAYTGDIARSHLAGILPCRVESIPTTDIVASPELVLEPDTPTILVSFARSGNSPESVGAFDIMQQYTKHIVHLVITCAAEGKLSYAAAENKENFVLLLPEETNDRGFAMTSSFSCMLLAALLFFDIKHINKSKKYISSIATQGSEILENGWQWVQQLAELHPDRIVYLGAGCFSELGKELSLKNMELTNGKIVSVKESVLGFRHGPKTIVNDKTLIMLMGSSRPYTNLYVRDIAKELFSDPGAHKLAVIDCVEDAQLDTNSHYRTTVQGGELPEAYIALVYALYGQMLGLFNSIAIGNTPDNPNPAGIVSRVVKGVTIHKP
ncbi:MAG: SIS domain-containing protein [Angelakisella sp.]